MTAAREGADPGPSKAADDALSDRWARSEAFFFNKGANIALLTLLMAFNVAMFLWGVWLFLPANFTTDNPVLRVTLPIARGGGRLVTWNAALLLLSGCKYFWTLARRTPLQLGFPIDNVMPHYHRIIALTVIIAGCIIHTMPQIVNYATGSLVPVDGQPLWFHGISAKQLLYTGSLLVVVFAMFFATTLERVRRTSWGFRIFWMSHVIGIMATGPLLLIHGTYLGNPFTIYFMALPIVLYLIDIFLRRYYLVTQEAELVSLKTHVDGSDQYVQLTIRQSDFRYSPGMYAELRIPAISRYEWHPFTIASAPNPDGLVVFYIQVAGRWTRALFQLAQQQQQQQQSKQPQQQEQLQSKQLQQQQETTSSAREIDQKTPALKVIGIRGGFGAPAQNYFNYKHIIVVGSGIGVTPLLSVWKYMVSMCRNADLDMSLVPRSTLRRIPDSIKYSKILMENELSHVRVTSFDGPLPSLSVLMAYSASVLESMTVNVCLYVFELIMLLGVFCEWLFKLETATLVCQMITSMVTIPVFGLKIVASLIAYRMRYVKSFVFPLEFFIVACDIASFLSSPLAMVNRFEEDIIMYFSFFAAFMALHTIRIFYIFYATARPPKIKVDKGAKQKKIGPESIKTITGVWVAKSYQGMSFAAADLVDTVFGLPPGFSLRLYASRDSHEDCERNNPFVDCEPRFALQSGRPNWHDIIRHVLDAAHSTNREGETVGVFFCGSPAIALTLQTVAQEVTAEHQYNHNGRCSCRVLVHKENF